MFRGRKHYLIYSENAENYRRSDYKIQKNEQTNFCAAKPAPVETLFVWKGTEKFGQTT